MAQTKRRGRWMLNAVLIVGLVAFVGFSFVPILTEVFQSEGATGGAQTASREGLTPEQQSQLQAREEGYELVLQRDPENEGALQGLLEVRMEMGDVRGAIEPLEKIAQLHADEPRYTVLLAQTQQYAGDYEGAAGSYRQILKSQPGNVEALQGLVGLLMAQNRSEAAVGLLQETIQTAPEVNRAKPDSIDLASVQLMLGDVYAQQERYDEAIAIYDAVMKENAEDFRPVYAKAAILKFQGKNAAAQALLTRAKELAPAEYKDQIAQEIESLSSPEGATEGATEETREGATQEAEPPAAEGSVPQGTPATE